MNHRLDELFVRAGGQFGHYGEPILPDIEVFAELIVKECIEIVEPCKCGCRCDQEVAITDSIIADIKEHFGVEE